MHLKLVNNNILRVAPQPLHITDKREIRARAINRVERRRTNESATIGYQFCNGCANPVPISDAEFCLPCANRTLTERIESENRAEDAKNLKVFALMLVFGAAIIFIARVVFQATR